MCKRVRDLIQSGETSRASPTSRGGALHGRQAIWGRRVGRASSRAHGCGRLSGRPRRRAIADTPRRGGVLLAAIGADAPSLDPHQEQHLRHRPARWLRSTARCSRSTPTTTRRSSATWPREWKIAPDGLTYTFKIRPGIQFHDGSPLTAADVKATLRQDHLPARGRPQRPEERLHGGRASVEAPDPSTVVFKLKFPSASLLANLASPWNVIYPEEVPGQGPELLQDARRWAPAPSSSRATRAAPRFEGERNPDYFVKDRPVPRRLQVLHQPGDLRARGGHPLGPRLHRVPRPAQRRGRRDPASSSATRSSSSRRPMTGQWGIAINNTVKPFTDVRVRKALTLGHRSLHRWAGCCTRSPACRTSGR